MAFDYEDWLKTAYDRLETLYQQKAAIEAEISALEEGIEGFAPLVNKPSKWLGSDAGVTDAVRAVLKADTSRIFTATEIRNQLLAGGVPLTQQNPMATIHQVLARLVEKGTVKISAHEAGRNRYQWANKRVITQITRRRVIYPPVADSQNSSPVLDSSLPNPLGKTLGAMLKEPERKK